MASLLVNAPASVDTSNSIENAAKISKQLLLCCHEAFTDEPKRIVETQLSRFDLWASNIGVFASAHASLDYRLRTAKTAKAAVDGNLDILSMHLLSAITGMEEPLDDDLDELVKAAPLGVSNFGLRLFHRYSSTVNPDARISALRLVESTMDTLHRLSLAIRKASDRNSLAKVPSLHGNDDAYDLVRELDNSGTASGATAVPGVRFDTTTAFEEYVRRTLRTRWLVRDTENVLDGWQKNYREAMLDRCVASIVTRRRQLDYFRDHQAKLAGRATTKIVFTMPKATKPALERSQLVAAPQLLSRPPLNYKDAQIANEQPSFQHVIGEAPSQTSGSKFQSTSSNLAPSTDAPSSAASSSAGGALSMGGQFDVPPAPELRPKEREKMCPYCCLVYPANIFATQKKSRRWRKHLLEDLQPYICLFRNCLRPGKTYRNFKEWQLHLSQTHTENWRCLHPSPDAAEEPEFLSTTTSEFQEHLALYHPILDASEAHSVCQAASQPASLPQWCFVCLAEQVAPAALEMHLAMHLGQAFLLALPARNEVDDVNVSSSRPSDGTVPPGEDADAQNEADLPDLRAMFEHDNDAAGGNTGGFERAPALSATDFENRLMTIKKKADDAQGRSNAWTLKVAVIQDFEDARVSRLSGDWRIILLAIEFCLVLRRQAFSHTCLDNGLSLSRAAEKGDEAVVRRLLEKGADIEAKRKGRTPLLWASAKGRKAVVQQLLDKGADVEAKDDHSQAPLLWASEKGYEAIVQQLLEKGADTEAKDNKGQTPLSWASSKGHRAVVQQLLEKGANTEAKNYEGRTPLFWASGEGHIAVVQQLLEKGANTEAGDSEGQTPLSCAAEYGREAVVQQLLRKGADIKTRDKYNNTPLSWAMPKGHEAVVQRLLRAASKSR